MNHDVAISPYGTDTGILVHIKDLLQSKITLNVSILKVERTIMKRRLLDRKVWTMDKSGTRLVVSQGVKIYSDQLSIRI